MRLNKGIKLITVGSIIGFSNIIASPIVHSYAEEITIPVNSATLQSLSIEEFQLNQEFSADVKNYTSSVSNDIKSMNLLLQTTVEAASVTVNEEKITSGEKANLELETGENLFTIVVTNGNDVSTYTITVVREKNNNNQLAKLSLSSGEIEFNPEVTSYNINVKNETDKITVTPETSEDTSTVQVNDTVVASKGHLVELPVGSSTISIIVTAENGSQRTYKISVTRAEKEEDEPEQNTETPSKPEQEDTQKPVTSEQPSRNTVSGSQSFSTEETPSQYSNSMSQAMLTNGALGDTETRTTANLDSLTVSHGTWNKSFASDEYTYHLDVAKDVTSVTISADSEESDAEIIIDKVISASSEVTIENKAKTVISVVVTHDEVRKTYIIVFDKKIEEEVTDATDENEGDKGIAVETMSTETLDPQTENTKELPNRNLMELGLENSKESSSFWQKILSFFGL